MKRIKQGDTVEVIAGKDVGERGEVVSVLNKENRVVVEGVNVLKKTPESPAGRTAAGAGPDRGV